MNIKENKPIKEGSPQINRQRFKFKTGRWYVCIKDYKESDSTVFHQGEIFKSIKDGAIGGLGRMAAPAYPEDYFRPASEEEALHALITPKFNIGDTIRIYTKKGEWYDKTIAEIGKRWYIFTDGKRYSFRGQHCWELVYSSEKLSSIEKTGENCEELTEFEKAVQQLANCITTAGTTEVVIDKASIKKLLSVARKQIQQEIIDKACAWIGPHLLSPYTGKQYLDDFRKAMED